MLMQLQREQIAEYGRKMLADGLTRNSGGYLAAFDRENRLAAVTPSGMAYSVMTPEDIVILDLNGNVIDGQHNPSSEWNMHAFRKAAYQYGSDFCRRQNILEPGGC